MTTPRPLYPWEARCGCPTCKVRPGQRCITMDTRYPPWWRFRDGGNLIGSPTAAHKARYELWCYLWGRDLCATGAVPSAPAAERWTT